MVPCKSTAEEVSFEWSHHRISSTDSKVRTKLHVSIIDSEREKAKALIANFLSFIRSSLETNPRLCEIENIGI